MSSPAWTLGSWVRIPLEAWMFVCVYSVFVLSCAGSGLATVWSLVQGVLPTVYKCKITEPHKEGAKARNGLQRHIGRRRRKRVHRPVLNRMTEILFSPASVFHMHINIQSDSFGTRLQKMRISQHVINVQLWNMQRTCESNWWLRGPKWLLSTGWCHVSLLTWKHDWNQKFF
jgi:hypothetical protein